MDELILEFESESENGKRVYITAKFWGVHDYEETRYGERQIFYWHLASLKYQHSTYELYEANDEEYKDFEREAKRLASKEAA